MSQAVLDRSVPSRRPIHLWVVGLLALLWNAFGVFDFVATQMQLAFYVGQFTEQQRAYFDSFPAWFVGVWGLGVVSALAGSIALLLARAWAVPAFAVSIACLAISSLYSFVLTDGAEMMGSAGVFMTLFIWAVALALLAYAVRQRRNGALR